MGKRFVREHSAGWVNMHRSPLFLFSILAFLLAFWVVKAQAQVELLVFAADAGAWKKGDVVVVKETPAVWGGREGLPDYVRIEVMDATYAQTLAYLQPWFFDIDYRVIIHQESTDGYRVQAYATEANASGENQAVRSDIEDLAGDWGMVFVSAAANAIRFDYSIAGAIASAGIWGNKATSVTFTEDSYTSATGVHRTSADYNAAGLPADRVAAKVTGMGGTVLANAGGVVQFDIDRTTVNAKIKMDFHDKIQRLHAPRRRYIRAVAIDAIVADRGTTTTTRAALLPQIRDRVDE